MLAFKQGRAVKDPIPLSLVVRCAQLTVVSWFALVRRASRAVLLSLSSSMLICTPSQHHRLSCCTVPGSQTALSHLTTSPRHPSTFSLLPPPLPPPRPQPQLVAPPSLRLRTSHHYQLQCPLPPPCTPQLFLRLRLVTARHLRPFLPTCQAAKGRWRRLKWG